jgi:hypothetical protein
MKILFFKGIPSTVSGRVFSGLIRWWTRGPYSHAELVFSDQQCFSSRPGDGVGILPISVSSLDWDIIDFPVSFEEEQTCRGWAEASVFRTTKGGVVVRRGYDWLGIFLSQVLPLKVDDTSRYFCSEAIVRCLQQVGWFGNLRATSCNPNSLYKYTHIS